MTAKEYYARKMRGAKAKSNGSSFESVFKHRCTELSIKATRMPNGCERYGNGPKDIKEVKTPLDWIISYNSYTALIDTKSIDDRVFPHSLIKPHQVLELFDHEEKGIRAGYVIYFKEVNQIGFMWASALVRRMDLRGSISHSDPEIQHLGTGLEYFDPRLIFLSPFPKISS